MRENMWLYHGKRVDNGEWVEGYYFKRDNHNFIVPVKSKGSYSINDNDVSIDLCYNVIPETVGMYVGEHISGVKVFENDIIKFFDHEENHFGVVKFGKYSASGSENIGFYVDWIDSSDNDYFRQDLGWWLEKPYVEIVGNAYDNKELIENA